MTMANKPVHWWWQRHPIMTRVRTPAWQWQRPHRDKGNNIIMATAKTPGLWRCQCIDDGNTITTRAMTPAQQQEDGCALMMARTTLLQGQWHQLDDYASSTMAEMPLQQEQQLPLQQQQRQLHINGNNTILTRATMQLQWQQGCLLIDDDNNAIATRATTPAWGQQQRHCNEGNNTFVDQRQQCPCYNGYNAILTTTKTCAHRQRQQWSSWGQQSQSRQWQKPCASMATTPSQRGWWSHLNNKQLGWRR